MGIKVAGVESRKRGLDKGNPVEAVTASCDCLWTCRGERGGLQLATVCTAINGTVLGEDVRMSRHGAEMAHPTCKSIGKQTFDARRIPEYKRMTQREREREIECPGGMMRNR